VINISNIIEKDSDIAENPIKKGLQKVYKIFEKDFVVHDFYKNKLGLLINLNIAIATTYQCNKTLTGFIFQDIAPPRKV
jgi:hypothetical protein